MLRFLKYSLLLPALCLLGCGGPSYVPVSGVVTMDGKPLKGVMVLFQPIATQGSDAGGVGSTARTDENGKFVLEASTPTATKGALVGRHTVKIATPIPPNPIGKPDSDAANVGGKGIPKLAKDPIPERYNLESQLTFDVPASGTDKANFELTSDNK